MATTEYGHETGRMYVDRDGQLHINGSSIYTDESGTAVSGTELGNIANVAAPVAAGSTLALDSTYSGKTIALDTAAGCTITLPAATGSGATFTFVVTVKNTTNQHRINVTGDDAFAGSVNIIDMDGSAQAAFASLVATDNDRFDMNGTTKGGQIGDWVQVTDIKADVWHIRGQLICPAGSNPATPFASGQVS